MLFHIKRTERRSVIVIESRSVQLFRHSMQCLLKNASNVNGKLLSNTFYFYFSGEDTVVKVLQL